MSKRVSRWNCEHANYGEACPSNDACRQKRRRQRVASAAATLVAVESEKQRTVTPVTAAFVALCVAALLHRERSPATITPMKPGRQLSLFQNFKTPPTKPPPRHLVGVCQLGCQC